MDISIRYNGKDIQEDLDLSSCILYDRFGGLLDNATLVLVDEDNYWSSYGVRKNDEIVIKADEYTTGKMYVDDYYKAGNYFTINATSMKITNKKLKSKIWRNVKLSEIMSDTAKNNNLILKTYGVDDYTYEVVSQIQETDLALLKRLCTREGYSIKVDDDCLIVFDDMFMEQNIEAVSISPSDLNNSSYSFDNNSDCVSDYTISYYHEEKGLIIHTAYETRVIGKSIRKIERVSTFDEAIRFAENYLKDANKYLITGVLYMEFTTEISAGSILKLADFNEFDGDYIIYEITYNLKKEAIELKIRKLRD